MILIILSVIFYLIQVIITLVFLIEGDFNCKKELKLFLIPYPYWMYIGIKWLIKYAISQYKKLD